MASPPHPPPHPPPPGLSRNHPLLPILKTCKTIDHLKQIHGQSLKSFHAFPTSITPADHLYLYSRLIHLSTTTFNTTDTNLHYSAVLLCHHPIPPNSFIYNTLIAASSSSDLPFHLYLRMLSTEVAPSKHTYPLLLKSCARRFLLPEGRQVQTNSVKLGFGSDVYVNNSLIHFYASCGDMDSARKVFDGMAERSVVSWNSVIDGYVRCGEYEVGIGLFREMQMQKMFVPDGFTIQSVACACGNLATPTLGMWVHRFSTRNRCGGGASVPDDVLVGNSLLDMYSKCGCIDMARQVFERMHDRDLVSWNHMILGFATNGLVEESLRTFHELCNTKHLSPNPITFIGVLTACNHAGLVADGLRYFKSMIIDMNIKPSIEHYGCLVDLLGRAGLIREALAVASSMTCKPDIVIWRSLLDNYHKTKAQGGGYNNGILEEEELSILAREILESEDSGGGFVLVSKMNTFRKRWEDASIVRGLMDEEGIQKQAGCSLLEIDNCVHEFLAGNYYF